MGSEPPQDPMSEVNRGTYEIAGSTEIKWNHREIRDSWTRAIGIVLLSIVLVLLVPLFMIAITLLASVGLYLFSVIVRSKEVVNSQDTWTERPIQDLDLVEDEKSLRRTTGEKFSLTGMELTSVSPRLPGSMAALVRALPTSDGFSITMTLRSGEATRLLEGGNLARGVEAYLRTKSKSELDTYMDYKSGLWMAKINYIGLVRDTSGVRFHESSVKGSIPSKGWKRSKPNDTLKRLSDYHGGRSQPSFFVVGQELSEWLIQLRSELANEVGSNVPGQFVVDIRSRPADLPLGVILNPDTLQSGPTTGLAFEDISNGVLVCGGNKSTRRDILALLLIPLLKANKRVMIISSNPEALSLASLHDSGIGFALGRNFILNPMDAETVHRGVYVPKLLRALETLADKSLTSAADLEVALGRAVALPNSTVADVKFEPDADVMTDDEIVKTNIHPVKLSLWGLEGLRKLHEGSGARAFYGTQTASMSMLSSLPLTVIVASLGDIPLDVFAVDLFLMKLSGLKRDKDFVLLIDDPDSLRTANNKYSRRCLWVDSLIKEVTEIASLIVTIDQPHMLSAGVKNELSSCISLRLRDERDIAAVSTHLALSVIGAGLHSKARWSARESSFLRTMEDGIALLVHNEVETAQPIRLYPAPHLKEVSYEELQERINSVLQPILPAATSRMSTLVAPASSSDGDLPIKILKLIERYEPLTEEAIRRFIQSSGTGGDIEGVLIRLKESSLILEGHEAHSGVSYKNYRLTMKGNMALRQVDKEAATA